MIIFISGSINAGKSTVAKILAKKLSNTALVEIDTLREMIEWMPIDQAVPINLENAVSVIKNFTKKGLNVIVLYPLSQKNYDYFVKELNGINTKMYFFTFSPKLEKILLNRGDRELNEKEKERIKHHYYIGINSPSFGIIIDNTNQTPKETAEEILKSIE